MGTMAEVVAETKMCLAEKIVKIMSEVQRIQKDDNVEFGKTKYKALSEEKITAIMHEKLVKYNILVYPIEQEWSREGTITHVNVKYRMVNAENPADFIEIVSCGDGADTQDKGSGKAMTYAFKYMWLRTFAMPTGEDPDKISSDELDAKEAQAKEEAKMKAESAAKPITKAKVKALESLLSDNGILLETVYELYKVTSLAELTEQKHMNIIEHLKDIKGHQDGK